jgi:hypothetical protein
MVKLGATIPKVKVVLAVWEPEVPVIVTTYCPRLAVLLAVSVSVLCPVVGFGLHDAVTPLGRPEAARVTFPVKPYRGVTETDEVPEPPGAMLTPPYCESVKLGA